MIDHDNLEEFHDPANYDLEQAANAAPRSVFYGDLVEAIGGPVLEIACGTGLVTIPLALRGVAVTGSDIARPMLDYARFKARQQQLTIPWIEADARQLALGQCFSCIFLTGNAFQAFLQRQDQERLFTSIQRHLAPGGTFAFETRHPSGHNLATQCEETPWYTYTSVQGHTVTVSGTQRYDPLTQIMHWTTYRRWRDSSGAQTKVTRIACRFTYPQELEALLYYNGFHILRQYGDWQHGELMPHSLTMITICRRR